MGPRATDLPPRFFVSQLHPLWQTATSIHWGRHATGTAATFGSYRLLLAQDPSVLVHGGSPLWTYDKAQNPELGLFELPGTSSFDQVLETTTAGLIPQTTYFAQLRATDDHGTVARSNITSAKTSAAPSQEIVVFAEREPAGYTIPSSFQRSTAPGASFAGSAHYRYTSHCGGPASCFENLRWQDLNLNVQALTNPANFAKASIHLAIACVETNSYWSHVRIALRDGAHNTSFFGIGGFTIRCDDTYHLLAFFLRHFLKDLTDAPLRAQDLLGQTFFEAGIGGSWRDGAIVRVDEYRIRW